MNDPVIFPQKLAGDVNIAVGAGLTVYTDSFKFGDVNEFAIAYILTATGTPSVKIEMQQSFFKPDIENIADSNFFIPKSVGDLETTLTSKTMQGGQLSPITAPYIRFKITDNNGGATDTVIKIWLSLQKKFSM